MNCISKKQSVSTNKISNNNRDVRNEIMNVQLPEFTLDFLPYLLSFASAFSKMVEENVASSSQTLMSARSYDTDHVQDDAVRDETEVDRGGEERQEDKEEESPIPMDRGWAWAVVIGILLIILALFECTIALYTVPENYDEYHIADKARLLKALLNRDKVEGFTKFDKAVCAGNRKPMVFGKRSGH